MGIAFFGSRFVAKFLQFTAGKITWVRLVSGNEKLQARVLETPRMLNAKHAFYVDKVSADYQA